MPKKCKLGFILNLTCLNIYWLLFMLKLVNSQMDIAIFSDNLLDNYNSVFVTDIDSILKNTSLSKRIEPDKPFCKSIISSIFKYSNYSKNAFETKTDYFRCEQIVEFFCEKSYPNKLIVSHNVFDCQDFMNIPYRSVEDYSTLLSNITELISLSPTITQFSSVLGSFMNRFSMQSYAIIYADTVDSYPSYYYRNLAAQLIYKLSADFSFTLSFSLPISSSLINDTLNSTVQIVFLILKCGEEVEFKKSYYNKIESLKINFISIYQSPQCIPLLDHDLSFNKTPYLYKLVPFDISLKDYATYQKVMLDLVNSFNKSSVISSGLEEVEDALFLTYYNQNSNFTSINKLNQNVTLKCYQRDEAITNHFYKYCYREFYFILFGISPINNITNYTKTAKIVLSGLFEENLTVGIDMTVNYTFINQAFDDSSKQSNDIFRDVLFGVVAIVIFTVVVCVIAYIARSRLMRKELSKGPNKILLLPEDLDFVGTASSTFLSRPNVRENGVNEGKSNVSLKSDDHNVSKCKVAKYKGDIVIVKFLKIPNFQIKNSTMRELRMLRDLRHENLNAFMGCYIDLKTPALIFDYTTKGSLQDIIRKKDINLDWNFKWSMLNDLCRGMRYIHHSPIKYHGNLKSRNCVVDSRWVLKLTDFGLPNIYSNQNFSRTLNISDLLWTAPEHLRASSIGPIRDHIVISVGSQAGDIYSFAIIMQEIIIRGAPFCMMGLSDEEIINKIKKPPPLLRPSVSKTAAPPEYVNIMRDCWSEQPELRPSFDQLHSMFKSLNGEKKVNIVDLMFKMVEQYTNNLEELVREKTEKLEEEKKKTEKLLTEMLPKTVAESLMSGTSVPPESFDCVTIYFSDIVGFTTISAFSSPIEVVALLNDLYTMFDETLNDFDVYKVETIGDAYMVVSGLPIKNGNKHAGEIATMALNLLHNCGKFKIRHLPGIPLRLRIGLHSGACVTGVVGLKMPRYCLFGDTVNTASRMESTSQAYRIHVSESAANILNEIGGYKLEFRGVTELKGKGMHKTYWLTGKEGFDKELPDPVISDNNHGVDEQLIIKIKQIKAERAEQERLQNLSNSNPESNENKNQAIQSENPNQNNNLNPAENTINKSLSSIRSETNKQATTNLNENNLNTTNHSNDTSKQINNTAKPKSKGLLTKNLSIESDEKKRIQSSKSNKFNKNDSGYSESTTANSTPTTGKTTNLDLNKHSKTINRMPDVDSVV